MGWFSNSDLKIENDQLRNEILALENMMEVKDKEIAFYKERGDRYIKTIETREAESIKLLEMAKDILKHQLKNEVK